MVIMKKQHKGNDSFATTASAITIRTTLCSTKPNVPQESPVQSPNISLQQVPVIYLPEEEVRQQTKEMDRGKERVKKKFSKPKVKYMHFDSDAIN